MHQLQMSGGRIRHACTLLECLFAVIVVGVLVCVLAIAAADARRLQGLSGSLDNLRQWGAGTHAYANAHADRVPGFSWEPGQVVDSPYADVRAAVLSAPRTEVSQRAQAIHMMRLYGNEPDLPVNLGWLPHVFYSHVPLVVFLGDPLKENFGVSPGDEVRQGWHDGSIEVPQAGTPLAPRWRMSSSYIITSTWWNPETHNMAPNRVAPASNSSWFVPTGAVFHQRTLSTTAFPSDKVMVYEEYSRFTGPRVAYFAYPEARSPLLFADGRAEARPTAEANRGWIPSSPHSQQPTRYIYTPAEWEPPSLGGSTTGDLVVAHYQCTRGGAAGRDFGPELPPP